MISSVTTNTWNISGPDFLAVYGILCAVAAAAAWIRWRRVLGPRRPADSSAPELDVYQVAMLAGGPPSVIVTAATNLYRAGRLTAGRRRGALELAAGPASPASGIERAVLEAVRSRPGSSVKTLRRDLRDAPAITAIASRLEHGGLLDPPAKQTRLRLELAAIGGLLVSLGVARVVAGASVGKPVAFLVVAVLAVLTITPILVGRVPRTTPAGRRVLKRVRSSQPGPRAMDAAMAVALGGAGALWLADPVSATELGLPRAGGWTGGTGAGGGGGGCGGGGGGCGGGGGGCGG